MDINEINETNSVREKLLNLLSGMLLNVPNYNDINILYNALTGFSEACVEDCPASLVEGLKKLHQWLKLNKDGNETHIKLEAEHTRLFFLGKYSVGFTASYYLSSNKTNKSAQWDDVIDFYYKNKYKPLKGILFDEDSAGVEMLFLSILAGKGANIKNDKESIENMNTQIEFYENHVNNWLPIFCEALIQKDDCPFYQAFALILKGYTEADYKIVKEMCAGGF